MHGSVISIQDGGQVPEINATDWAFNIHSVQFSYNSIDGISSSDDLSEDTITNTIPLMGVGYIFSLILMRRRRK